MIEQVAVAVIVTPEDSLIMQRRRLDNCLHPGMLGLFGGKIEPGENPALALERELKEELHTSMSDVQKSYLGKYSSLNGTYPFAFHVFKVAVDGVVLAIDGAPERYGVRAIPEIQDMQPETKKLLLRLITEGKL